jgi:hypothetical protein
LIGATTFNHDICNPGTARKSDPHASQTFFSTPISTIVQSLRGHARRFSAFDLAWKLLTCAELAMAA